MRKSEQNVRLYQRATKKEIERKSKKHKCVIVYDSSMSMLEMRTGPLSVGQSIHRELGIKHNTNLCWYAFGGYLNGCPNGKQLQKALETADYFYVDFRKRPENEPAKGEGAKALQNHICKAKKDNPRLKIFLQEGSQKLLKLPGAVPVNSIEEIII